MDFKTRAALFNDGAKWLEETGSQFKDTDNLNELIACVKDAAATEVLDVQWVNQLTPKYGKQLFYEGFLYRMR
jgi:uncharacterized lipoprotein YehR (DUF1307 family)